MLHRSFKPAKCKTALKLATARLKVMKNKKEAQVKQLKRDVAQLLDSGQDPTARIQVEHVIREQKTLAAYDLIEIYCELIVARLPIIESQKNCPIDLKEAVTSVIFASPRCSDIQELDDVRKHLTAKYGKEFVSAAIELRPDCGVSRMMVEKLSAVAPDGPTKINVLTAIAEEHNIKWEPKTFAEKDSKPHEDLLNGPSNFQQASKMNPEPPSVQTPPTHEKKQDIPGDLYGQNASHASSQNFASTDIGSNKTTSFPSHHETRPSGTGVHRMESKQSFSGNGDAYSSGRQNWNMEFTDATSAAQAAAEAAERASMAARAAAELSSRGNNSSQPSTPSRMSSMYGQRDEGLERHARSKGQAEQHTRYSVNDSFHEIDRHNEEVCVNEKLNENEQGKYRDHQSRTTIPDQSANSKSRRASRDVEDEDDDDSRFNTKGSSRTSSLKSRTTSDQAGLNERHEDRRSSAKVSSQSSFLKSRTSSGDDEDSRFNTEESNHSASLRSRKASANNDLPRVDERHGNRRSGARMSNQSASLNSRDDEVRQYSTEESSHSASLRSRKASVNNDLPRVDERYDDHQSTSRMSNRASLNSRVASEDDENSRDSTGRSSQSASLRSRKVFVDNDPGIDEPEPEPEPSNFVADVVRKSASEVEFMDASQDFGTENSDYFGDERIRKQYSRASSLSSSNNFGDDYEEVISDPTRNRYRDDEDENPFAGSSNQVDTQTPTKQIYAEDTTAAVFDDYSYDRDHQEFQEEDVFKRQGSSSYIPSPSIESPTENIWGGRRSRTDKPTSESHFPDVWHSPLEASGNVSKSAVSSEVDDLMPVTYDTEGPSSDEEELDLSNTGGRTGTSIHHSQGNVLDKNSSLTRGESRELAGSSDEEKGNFRSNRRFHADSSSKKSEGSESGDDVYAKKSVLEDRPTGPLSPRPLTSQRGSSDHDSFYGLVDSDAPEIRFKKVESKKKVERTESDATSKKMYVSDDRPASRQLSPRHSKSQFDSSEMDHESVHSPFESDAVEIRFKKAGSKKVEKTESDAASKKKSVPTETPISQKSPSELDHESFRGLVDSDAVEIRFKKAEPKKAEGTESPRHAKSKLSSREVERKSFSNTVDEDEQASSENESELNFGTLTGGLRHKGYTLPVYSRKPSDASFKSTRSSSETSTTIQQASDSSQARNQETYNQRISRVNKKSSVSAPVPDSDSDSTDSDTDLTYNQKEEIKVNEKLGSRIHNTFWDDDDPVDDTPKRTSANKGPLGPQFSRRTRGAPSKAEASSYSRSKVASEDSIPKPSSRGSYATEDPSVPVSVTSKESKPTSRTSYYTEDPSAPKSVTSKPYHATENSPTTTSYPSSRSSYTTETSPTITSKPSSRSSYGTETSPTITSKPSSRSSYGTKDPPVVTSKPSSRSSYGTEDPPVVTSKPSSKSSYDAETASAPKPTSRSSYMTENPASITSKRSSKSTYEAENPSPPKSATSRRSTVSHTETSDQPKPAAQTASRPKQDSKLSSSSTEQPANPVTRTASSGGSGSSRTPTSTSEAPSRESSLKKPSHVHPKLPDYDDFVQALQRARQ